MAYKVKEERAWLYIYYTDNNGTCSMKSVLGSVEVNTSYFNFGAAKAYFREATNQEPLINYEGEIERPGYCWVVTVDPGVVFENKVWLYEPDRFEEAKELFLKDLRSQMTTLLANFSDVKRIKNSLKKLNLEANINMIKRNVPVIKEYTCQGWMCPCGTKLTVYKDGVLRIRGYMDSVDDEPYFIETITKKEDILVNKNHEFVNFKGHSIILNRNTQAELKKLISNLPGYYKVIGYEHN